MEHKILSFDTSTKKTGVAVFVDGQLQKYKIIDLSDIKNTDERFRRMIKMIYETIDKVDPDVVAVEEMVVPRNPQTQRMLTMILGAIYGRCFSLNIHYCSLRPTQWRKLVRNEDEKLPKGRDDLKEWSIKKVEELYGVKGIDDNVSDAILIGQAFIKGE